MYQNITIYLLLASLCLLPTTALAHNESQPHFFKVNGNYLDHYPIKSTSLPDFILPQEISPALLVNEPITFQIEKNNIPLPDKKSSDNSFTIDFGDGQKFKGIQTEHTYLEVGSYILTISVKPILAQKEIVFDRVLINIVPDKNYQLPKATIKVNGVPTEAETIIDFRNQVSIDGTDSKSSNQIVNYFWDLGDGVSKDSSKLDHTYANYNFGANLLLRVKDQKGFIADTTVRLIDKQKQDISQKSNNISNQNNLVLFVIGCIFILAFIIFRIRKMPRSKLPY